ncbi:MAG: FtsQ-type POTRA domain-containing protein [Syntrophales bacterium]|nr:FtsQ-type POTRA domain-containing protein [Syntrophales bacterium]
MGNVQQSRISAGRHRLKRRSGEILSDILKTSLLLTGILLVTALLILGYSQTMSTPYFGLRETQVRGLRELTEKDVLVLADLKPAQNLLAVNADAIRDRVRKHPWIRDVYVGRELPRRLVIEVRERTAIALLKKGDGFYLMDADGLAFKKLEAGDESDLPVLTGCYRDGRPNQPLLTKALDLFHYLSTADGLFSIKSIAEVNGDEIFGFSIFTDSGLCLRLGFDHYDNKIRRLKPVLDDLEKRNVNLKYVMIDLADPAKITVQKRHILAPATPGGPAKGYRT